MLPDRVAFKTHMRSKHSKRICNATIALQFYQIRSLYKGITEAYISNLSNARYAITKLAQTINLKNIINITMKICCSDVICVIIQIKVSLIWSNMGEEKM